MEKRGYIEIDCNQLKKNVEIIKEQISPSTKILCVIKTNAYGHGAIVSAKVLEPMSCVEGFAVATAEEAIELREAGITKTIMILGYCFPEDYEVLIGHNIILTLFQKESFCQANHIAKVLGTQCRVHVKIETGMNRLGMIPNEDTLETLCQVSQLPAISLEGIFTHFSCADEENTSTTKKQYDIYRKFTQSLEERLPKISLKRHISNSAGILTHYGDDLDYVRAGIILYGIYPSNEVPLPQDVKPILALKSTLLHIRTVDVGEGISYGKTYCTDGKRIIATVPIGYGDGYPRDLSNKSYVLVRGQKAPIVGRICMDYCMIDVTHISRVREGDCVTLIGSDGEERIRVEDLSEQSAHFYYEIPCSFNNRLSRIYLH